MTLSRYLFPVKFAALGEFSKKKVQYFAFWKLKCTIITINFHVKILKKSSF